MSAERLPWFKCIPSALLGALSGMQPDEGYLYVTILLRIYETGGPIKDSPRILSRRTGMTERRVSSALASLVEMGKVFIAHDGAIDSASTHENLAAREELQNGAKKAGKASAQKRTQKDKQNQQNSSTPVDIPLNDTRSLETKTKISSSLRSEDIASSLRSDAKPRAKKPKSETVLEILETCLSPKTSADLIEHRKAKRAPLTPRAAELLAKQFRDYGNPEAAAEAMIMNGWQGFYPQSADKQIRAGRMPRAGPGGRSNGTTEALAGFLEDDLNGYSTSETGTCIDVSDFQLEWDGGRKEGQN